MAESMFLDYTGTPWRCKCGNVIEQCACPPTPCRVCQEMCGSYLDFGAELAWAWAEYRHLHDCPPSSDKWRWPSEETCQGLLAFNRDCQTHLEMRTPSDAVDDAITSLRCRYAVYNYILTAQSARTPLQRRSALASLRSMLGADYHLGRLPGHVPLEMFQPVE